MTWQTIILERFPRTNYGDPFDTQMFTGLEAVTIDAAWNPPVPFPDRPALHAYFRALTAVHANRYGEALFPFSGSITHQWFYPARGMNIAAVERSVLAWLKHGDMTGIGDLTLATLTELPLITELPKRITPCLRRTATSLRPFLLWRDREGTWVRACDSPTTHPISQDTFHRDITTALNDPEPDFITPTAVTA